MTTEKMTFGQWVGLNIKGNATAKLMRVDAGHFQVDGLVHIAESMDQAVFMAQLEGRKLTPLESFAVEVLIALGGWNNLKEAREAFKQHIEREATE
jgi:hypothetical protein